MTSINYPPPPPMPGQPPSMAPPPPPPGYPPPPPPGAPPPMPPAPMAAHAPAMLAPVQVASAPVAVSPLANAMVTPEFLAMLRRQEELANQRLGGGGDENDWYKTAAPEIVGQSKDYYVLVMPQLRPTPPENWPFVPTALHGTNVRGQYKSITCPRYDAILNGVDPGVAPSCAVCDEQEARFSASRRYPEKSQDREYWFTLAGYMRFKQRYIFNIFDLDNPMSHVKIVDGVNKIVPKLYGMGQKLYKQWLKCLKDTGPLWSPGMATPMRITASRKGKEEREVEYDIFPVAGQIGLGRVPQGFEAVYDSLVDLHQQRRRPSERELIDFLPPDALTRSPAPSPAASPPPSSMHTPMATQPLPPNPMAPPPSTGYMPPSPYPPAAAAPPPPPAPAASYPPPPPVAAQPTAWHRDPTTGALYGLVNNAWQPWPEAPAAAPQPPPAPAPLPPAAPAASYPPTYPPQPPPGPSPAASGPALPPMPPMPPMPR